MILKDNRLILASTSEFRRELLQRLALPFVTFAPQVDEAALAGETAAGTAIRLAEMKARAASTVHRDALIIGSDQVAELDGEHIGKPGDHPHALAQLRKMRGRTVTFHTAVVLLNAASGRMQQALVPTQVSFRRVSDAQIEAYLRRETPYNCAGSARCEGLGIALIEAIRGDDPNALIGLPLIALVTMLQNEGIRVV